MPPLPSAEAEELEVEQAAADTPTVNDEKQEGKKKEGKKRVGSRKLTPMQRMLEIFVEEKGKELKQTTMVSYSTFCKQLGAWLRKHYPNLTSGEFTHEIAVEYLEFVNKGGNSNDKKQVRNRIDENRVSPRTYNNNMKMGRGIFTWAVEHCYLDENPFAKIKKKREGEKTRTIIPAEDRTKIYNYLCRKTQLCAWLCRWCSHLSSVR